MDLIAVIIIGIVVASTGVINPKPKDPEEIAKAPETQVTTPVVQEIKLTTRIISIEFLKPAKRR